MRRERSQDSAGALSDPNRMPKFGIPGLVVAAPARARLNSKEKQKSDPNLRTSPNLPTAVAQHTPPSASSPPAPRSPISPHSEEASSIRRGSKVADGPAFQPAAGMQHLLSAREMATPKARARSHAPSD